MTNDSELTWSLCFGCQIPMAGHNHLMGSSISPLPVTKNIQVSAATIISAHDTEHSHSPLLPSRVQTKQCLKVSLVPVFISCPCHDSTGELDGSWMSFVLLLHVKPSPLHSRKGFLTNSSILTLHSPEHPTSSFQWTSFHTDGVSVYA